MKNKYRYALVIFVALAIYPFFRYVLKEDPAYAFFFTLYTVLGGAIASLCSGNLLLTDKFMKYRYYVNGFVFIVYLYGLQLIKQFVERDFPTSWLSYLFYIFFYLGMGWLFAYFMKSEAKDRLKKNLIALKDGEKVIEANNASFLQKGRWLNGSLYLTNYRWIFSSKKKKKEYFAEFERKDVQLWKWRFLTKGLLFEKKYKINISFPKWWVKQVNKL